MLLIRGKYWVQCSRWITQESEAGGMPWSTLSCPRAANKHWCSVALLADPTCENMAMASGSYLGLSTNSFRSSPFILRITIGSLFSPAAIPRSMSDSTRWNSGLLTESCFPWVNSFRTCSAQCRLMYMLVCSNLHELCYGLWECPSKAQFAQN